MPNRLINSTSPYLQQHADNPVDWHEWSPETLVLSRDSGKPILLSIGYSACHWCHVMAHESFEDEDVAALMNALFVNIKVDREERPDIDQIYQAAHAMLTQRSGGWPLTMFLAPDTTPFFGGTYFPKTARYGLPGFTDLLKRVEQYYRESPAEVREQNTQLLTALKRGESRPTSSAAADLSREPIDAALHNIADTFDAARGGFGQAPKFPHPEMIEFCLRRYAESGDENARRNARHMACFTLEQMCRGGIYDQLGGGFARYSVDATWTIPHFEKMLYDNGPLLRLLADAWLVAEHDEQKQLFARCARQTAAWVMREMQSPGGGYYSTLDADSEGHEGKFYVWTADAARSLLSPAEWEVAVPYYGLDRRANFEEKFWNLTAAQPLAMVANTLGQAEGDCAVLLESARQKLFAARAQRIHPGRDEKILTSWNALMIEGMAHAARVFGEAAWLASARKALAFMRATMWDAGRERLNATHKDGKTHLNAYLDDYAYLAKAILEVLQADFRADDLAFVRRLAEVLLEQFEDRERGGFYFTSHDHEQLIQRPKPGFDNATPSGNGIAALVLLRLAHLYNEPRHTLAAEHALTCFFAAVDDHPSGHGSLLMALQEWLQPTQLVILAGPAAQLGAWQTLLAAEFLPTTVSLALANGTADLPAALQRPAADRIRAYVCQGPQCLPPIVDQAALRKTLEPEAHR
ncbi:MAG TPA: thioredoxin domain-containing protein [Usitatibacteraceae bacterium]